MQAETRPLRSFPLLSSSDRDIRSVTSSRRAEQGIDHSDVGSESSGYLSSNALHDSGLASIT